MNNYIFYGLNILLFAIPLALTEISLEKANGWGGGFSKDKWYGKSFIKGTAFGRQMIKVTRFKEPPLNYHIIIILLFPTVFILEYIFGAKNIWLLISCFWGVNLFGDLSWFCFNWYFDSLTQLLKGPNGSISWHRDWVKIGKNSYLPAVYFIWLALSIIFFGISLL
jgi:hypothetical protein